STSPAILSLGRAWLRAEQFRPQHVRNKEGDPPMQPTSGTSTIWLSLAIAVPGISLRRLWLLHPVERRKGRPGAHVAAWWSASEVLVLAGAAELPGVSRARLGCRQRAYDPRGEQEHQRLYRAWRSGHSRIIKVCPAPACQMRR